MKQNRFIGHVGVGLLLSIGAAVAVQAGQLWFPLSWVCYGTLWALGMSYVCYLLWSSPTRIGIVTTFAMWFAATAILDIVGTPPMLFAAAQVAIFWMIRCVHFHRTLVASALDGALTILAFFAGVISMMHTNSIFAGLWCFFLLQAFVVFVPGRVRCSAAANVGQGTSNIDGAGKQFADAQRNAENALRRMTATQ